MTILKFLPSPKREYYILVLRLPGLKFSWFGLLGFMSKCLRVFFFNRSNDHVVTIKEFQYSNSLKEIFFIYFVLQPYRLQQLLSITLPAVDHHWAGVRGCRGFHSSYKGQQSSGVIGHPVLRPGCKVELTHLMLSRVSSLSPENSAH